MKSKQADVNETINGLHSCKPENGPTVGEIKTFLIEHRPAKDGKKAWIKIKNATPKFGGEPYRILQAESTGYTDDYGNMSFNIEIEPAVMGHTDRTAASESTMSSGEVDKQTGSFAHGRDDLPPDHSRNDESEIEKYANYSLRVFSVAWDKAGVWIQGLPKQDAEEMSVNDYYDKRMRVAQHIAIETAKIIRRERF